MHKFNTSLFLSLPSVLNTTKRKIGIAVTNSNWFVVNSSTQTPNPSVAKLVNLCNAFRIDIRPFFLSSQTPSSAGVPTPTASHAAVPAVSTTLIYPECAWTPIVFHPSRLRYIYDRNNPASIMQKDILVDVPVTKLTFMKWISEEKSPIKVDSLLRVCNLYNLDPMSFFDDANSSTNVEKLISRQLTRITRLEQELSEARSMLSSLQPPSAAHLND